MSVYLLSDRRTATGTREAIQSKLPYDRDKLASRCAGRWPMDTVRLWAAVVVVVFLAGLAEAARGQTAVGSKRLSPSLRAADLFALRERLGATTPVSDSFELVQRLAFPGPLFQQDALVAFEENKFFIYAVGEAAKAGKPPQGDAVGEQPPRFVRRFIFLKPATFVVDDHLHRGASAVPVRWLFYSSAVPQVAGDQVRLAGPEGEILFKTLLPGKVAIESTRQAGDAPQAEAEYVVEVAPENGSSEVRFLHVLHLGDGSEERSAARSELVEEDGQVRLTVSASDRTHRLTLPPVRVGAGDIEVTEAQGQAVLARRVLPLGVLPHGPEGTRLLERWDSAYRRERPPGWDVGRPSPHLKKTVEEGTLGTGRAVVLGCGSGTNAVYLAGEGFDVTAVDIAPTALSQAARKAKEAGVSVRWLLADVLALPALEPFDVVFDRGCYHGVRRQNAAGYVESLRRLTRPGSLALILAGNANEARHYGPPRVNEEEICGDFASHFDIVWLKEIRFNTLDPQGDGAWAWSILLRRRADQ